ncbi:MAG: hypothetical protein ACE5KM_06005 [Planctomycetaceae bacterium]
MQPRRITVYKLGGSLLELPDLVPRLKAVLRQRESRPLVIVGGGAAADLVRQWDAAHGLGERAAHWLAICAMALNERLLESLLPESQVVSNRDEALTLWERRRTPILCALDALRLADNPLPETWDVTSDSIAAFIARDWSAGELVLIKSRDKPPGGIAEATTAGCVDAHFGKVAPALPCLGWINLRDPSPGIQSWVAGGQFVDA